MSIFTDLLNVWRKEDLLSQAWDESLQMLDLSHNMFNKAENFNQPLNNWNVSNVTDMRSMFREATNFNQPLNVWNVSEDTNMRNMFEGALKMKNCNKPKKLQEDPNTC